jgi:hypothetical protein
MIRRMFRLGLSIGTIGTGVELLLAGGAAYLVWEHDQGKHAQPHMLCPICWFNKIAPAPESAAATGSPGSAEAAGEAPATSEE